MKQERNRSGRKGFTIAELTVGMVSASILIMSVSIMLFAAFRDLSMNRRLVETQRDAAAAMHALDFGLRGASRFELTVTTNRINVAGSGRSFYRSGRTLWYDPDTNAAGNEVALVNDKLLGFSASVTQRQINIGLVLTNAGQTLSITSSIALRNTP